MATYRIQHCFQGGSGLAADKFCNTLYYTSAIPPDTAAVPGVHGDLIAQAVRDFYATGSPNSISQWMSDEVNNPFRTIRIYDVAAAPEAPAAYAVTDSAVPFPAADVSAMLPEEVAVCMSFSAVSAGASPARRRGRIFIGPLNTGAVGNATGDPGPCHVDETLMAAILAAADAFAAELVANDAQWVVYSPTDAGAFAVVQVSVDNAFDTMRKRGVSSSQTQTLAL